MIKVQMAVDHNIDFFRRDSNRVQILQQLCRLIIDLPHFVGKLVADPGFDQDYLLSAAHHHRIQARRDPVLFIRTSFFLPQHLRHYAEKSAPIQAIDSVRNGKQFKITK